MHFPGGRWRVRRGGLEQKGARLAGRLGIAERA